MEWRVQTSVSCAEAFSEAQRWIEGVTGKSFGCKDFRAALENGVLLCDLINQLKPGIIKRVNRLSTPIAGLDNVNVFLKACDKLGLNESQLFHPGDLQDVSTRVTLRRDESNRRLKNVLITIYWLGRKAHLDTFYSGPQLNFKAFEGLLGLALSKVLDEGSNVFVKDGGCREGWSLEREERQRMRPSDRRVNSVDSDSLDAHALRPNSEGCGSDAEAEQVFRMETSQPPVRQNKGYIPTPLRRKQGREENGRVSASPITRENENKVRPERPVQVNPGWIWSKSLSDIPMVYPVRKLPSESTILDVSLDTSAAEEWNQQRAGATDSEAQWQDDLTKWKNRRRSSKSDHRRKSQDREHVINQMTNGAVTILKSDAQGVRLLKRDHQSPRRSDPVPDPHSTSPPSKSSSCDLRPRTRALLARSYTTATLNPQNSAHTQRSSVGAMPAADVEEETALSSLASDGAEVTTPSLDCPFSSQTQVKAQGFPALFPSSSEPAQPVLSNQISTLVTTLHPKEPTKSPTTRDPTGSMSNHKEVQSCVDTTFCPDAVNQTTAVALTNMSHQNHKTQEESHKTSWEPAVDQGRSQQAAGVYKYLSRTATWSGSASLPRGYRRSEGSSRLSSAITARPFGTKQSRVSSLPRLCKVDDNRGLLLNREKEEFLSPPTKSSLKRQTAASHLRSQNQASVRQKKANQAKLNGTAQDQEGKADGVSRQTTSDANGYQPHTQTHHYKSSALPTTKVDHSNMRVSLTLKPNSRADFGFQTRWDSTGARVKYIQLGSPAELCQLCVDDEIVAVDGVAVTHMTYNQWQDKMTSSLHTGSLTMDIRRYGNKDWSTSEGGHHKQPGQSRMTLNLTTAAPVLIARPDHHANSTAPPETTKALKFNGEAKNVTQDIVMNGGLPDSQRPFTRSKDYSKVGRKNQKRRAEFFRQRGLKRRLLIQKVEDQVNDQMTTSRGSETAISDLQVPSLSSSSTSWSWDHEEDRRRQEKWQEEQERLLQEQYQRDQERLEAAWQRAQQDAMGDLSRKSGQGVSPASSQLLTASANHKTGEEEPSPISDELKEAGSTPQSNTWAAHDDKITVPDWAVDSCGFAQLSAAHRAKSLSTPALAASHKQTRGDRKKRTGQSLSKAELDRQQILEEMKKRTQLLTDNSWIRQRSSSLYKEPVQVGAALKRHESLDNLDTLHQSTAATAAFVYPRPHSAAGGYCAPSRNPSSRYSAGPVLSQRNGSVNPPHQSSGWAATDISEEVKLESRFKSETGSPATLVPPMGDQHAILQITE